MLQALGYDALIGIISHVFFIIITWRLMQSVRVEEIFKKGRVKEAQLLFIFIAIAIGTTVSRFFLDILDWSQELIYLMY